MLQAKTELINIPEQQVSSDSVAVRTSQGIAPKLTLLFSIPLLQPIQLMVTISQYAPLELNVGLIEVIVGVDSDEYEKEHLFFLQLDMMSFIDTTTYRITIHK